MKAFVRGRDARLADAFVAIRLLVAGRWTVDDLGAELGLQRRTTYRLLSALRSSGLRIERHPEGRLVYLRLTRDTVLEALGLAARPALSASRSRR